MLAQTIDTVGNLGMAGTFVFLTVKEIIPYIMKRNGKTPSSLPVDKACFLRHTDKVDGMFDGLSKSIVDLKNEINRLGGSITDLRLEVAKINGKR